jgi:1D-myo-inositol 3-kinase
MLVVVGYLLHDILDIEGSVTEQPGGPATYCSLAAKKLGMDVGIVSRIGSDYKYHDMLEGIDVYVKTQDRTTRFYNIYRSGKRKQKVAHIGKSITAEDFPERFLHADAIHIGPVINEVSVDLLKHVKENSYALITLDPQGFLRKEIRGEVVAQGLDFDVLKYIDIFRCSVDDLESARLDVKDITRRCDKTIVTHGRNGAALYWEGKQYIMPAFRAVEKDPTGAGDAFIAGFIKKFLETRNPEEACVYANATASFCVEAVGISGLADVKSVDERLEKGEKNVIQE